MKEANFERRGVDVFAGSLFTICGPVQKCKTLESLSIWYWNDCGAKDDDSQLYFDDAFAAFDMVNAFGEISRAEFFENVLKSLPEIALYVLQLWGTKGTFIYCVNSSCSWQVNEIVDGLRA